MIVDEEYNIVARCMPKFMNWGQPGEDEIDLDQPVTVVDKADGSLGILYPTGASYDGTIYQVATRGSFTSDQALHASDLWIREFHYECLLDSRYTYMVEIVYPANRIVLDYGDLDTLIILGAVEVETGDWLGPREAVATIHGNWPGRIAQTFPYGTMTEALEAAPRPNAEGFVVCQGNKKVKIKQEDYLILHRLVTNLNQRTIWEAMQTETNEEILEKFPDEFHGYIRETLDSLEAAYDDRMVDVLSSWLAVKDIEDRKEFACHPD